MAKQIRVGIIGQGRSGRDIHDHALTTVVKDRYETVAVADPLRDHGGGGLLNTGPHPVDQVLQLIGTDAMPKVFCLMDRAVTRGDAEDHVKVVLTRPGRPITDLEISSCIPSNLSTCQGYGTHGGLTGTMDRLEWKRFDPAKAPEQHLVEEPLPGPSCCTRTLPWQTASRDAPEDGLTLFDTMAKASCENLHAALTRGTPLAVPMEHVRLQVAVIEECHRQAPLPRMAKVGAARDGVSADPLSRRKKA